MGFVYLLLEVDRYGNEAFKIGITKRDVDKRVRELQTGNSNTISLLKLYETENYKKVEKLLHGRYIQTQSNNEWFNLTNEEVFSFIDTCKKADYTASLMKDNPFF